MKDSAWYYKLWRKKLNELPVDGNADLAWAKMQRALDKQMPADTAKKSIVKPVIAKIVTLLGYALPAAAMIGTITYFNTPKPAKQNVIRGNKHNIHYNHKNGENRHTLLTGSTLIADSAVFGIDKDSSAYTIDSIAKPLSTDLKATSSQQIAGNINHPTVNFNVPKSPIKVGSQSYSNNKDASVAGINRYNKPSNSLRKSTKGSKNAYASLSRNVSVAGKLDVPAGNGTNGSNSVDHNNNDLPVSSNKNTGDNTGTSNIEQKGSSNNETLSVLNNKDKANKSTTAAKEKKAKIKTNRLRQDLVTPAYNYGFEVGLNIGSHSNNLFAGVFANYAITKRLLVGAGLRVNASKRISGVYNYPVTYRRDSVVSYTINDSRKVVTMDIPLNLEYKLNNKVSIKAGPVVSFPISQYGKSSSITPLGNLRDSIYRSKGIDSLIQKSTLNRINFGFNGGVGFHFNHVGLEARYQQLAPYKVSNSLGSYKQTNKSFQISLSYRFK